MEALADDPEFPQAGRLATGAASAARREADPAKLADVREPLRSLAAEAIRLMASDVARLAGPEREREAVNGRPARRAARPGSARSLTILCSREWLLISRPSAVGLPGRASAPVASGAPRLRGFG